MGLVAGVSGAAITALGAGLGYASFDLVWPILAVCTVAGALVHDTKQAITEMVDNRAGTLRKRLEAVSRNTGDIHGIVRLGRYTQDLPLPFGGGWALTGDSAALLARDALVREPSTILELGSGVSTLILGQILKDRGEGRLLSVDHDPKWANQTRQYIAFLGLADVVSVVDAPLKHLTLENEKFEWYDIPQERLDDLGEVDLLIVDGPPQSSDNPAMTRYPAFPMLRGRLSPRASIFVDDASRKMESKMVERWQNADPDWDSQWFYTVDGVCLLTRRPSSQPKGLTSKKGNKKRDQSPL